MAAATVKLASFADAAPDPKGRQEGLQAYRATAAEVALKHFGTIADIVKIFKMHRGRLVTAVEMWTEQLDSHASAPLLTLTGRFTDGTTTVNVFVASVTARAAGGGIITPDPDLMVNWYLKDIFDTPDWRFEVTVAASGATEAAGNYGFRVHSIGQWF